ncbi:MAG: bifunctional diguanylate cyclase/phosphodiesterase [Acidimicrobiales bacterium]
MLSRYALTSFVVIAAIGLTLAILIQQAVRSEAIDDATRAGTLAANIAVSSVLTADDLQRDFVPLSDERFLELDQTLTPSLQENGIVRLKVWNRQHWLTYSDNPALRGRWFAGSADLEETFEGASVSEFTDLSAPEERADVAIVDEELLAVYVPIRLGADGALETSGTGEIIGAYEIYLPTAPIYERAWVTTYRLVGALAAGTIVLYLALFGLVRRASKTIVEQAEENLHQATHDEVTGLGNRELLLAELNSMLDSGRGRMRPGSLLLLGLDGFDTVNDTLGHQRGDAVLRAVADRLAGQARSSDLVARVGVDEFAVVLGGNVSAEQLPILASRFLASMLEPIDVEGVRLDVRASAGICLTDGETNTAAELLRRSRVALGEAKSQFTTVEVYRPALERFSPEALALLGEVRSAIADGQFELYYQPQVDNTTAELVGAEALVRWHHPERGFLPPFSFMPAVEVLPIGRELTDHILRTAVEQIAVWQAQGRSLAVSVNLSPRDCNDTHLPSIVAGLLDEFGVEARWLHLELTEGNIVANQERTVGVLTELRELGCEIAIDDFGTGYASLSYLATLPASVLKIDQSFVREMLTDEQADAIVRYSIGLGHAMGMEIVAEGIEDAEVMAALAEAGCDVAQGYYVAKPMPVAELEAWMEHYEPSTFAVAHPSVEVS